MLRVLPLVVVAIVFAGGSAIADRTATGKPSLDISGSYTSNWGRVTLRQNGNHVTGSYVYEQGRLEGDLDGNMLRYTWHESDATGRGIWVIASNGELIGTWGTSDDLSGGGWRLTPAKQIAN